MKSITFSFLFTFFGLHIGLAQNNEIVGVKDSISVDYSKNYFTLLRLSQNFGIVQGFSAEHFVTYSKIEIPTLLMYKLGKNTNLFTGANLSLIKNGETGSVTEALYGTFGVEHEAKENLFLEAKFNYRLTDEIPINTDYTYGSKSSFTIGSKFKF